MSRYLTLSALTAWLALHGSPAGAQEVVQTVDLGTLRNSELSVVQKLLHPMEERNELGLHAGVLPFDVYTLSVSAGATYTRHLSETFGVELGAGGGYGFKSGTYRELEGPDYGIAAEAYRYLGHLTAAAEWSPAYAKLNWQGKRVYHHNLYLLGGLGATVEQSVLPSGHISIGPGAMLGLGLRVFHGERSAIRVELRDNIFRQYREQTGAHYLKQNVSVSLGFSRFSAKKGR